MMSLHHILILWAFSPQMSQNGYILGRIYHSSACTTQVFHWLFQGNRTTKRRWNAEQMKKRCRVIWTHNSFSRPDFPTKCRFFCTNSAQASQILKCRVLNCRVLNCRILKCRMLQLTINEEVDWVNLPRNADLFWMPKLSESTCQKSTPSMWCQKWQSQVAVQDHKSSYKKHNATDSIQRSRTLIATWMVRDQCTRQKKLPGRCNRKDKKHKRGGDRGEIEEIE